MSFKRRLSLHRLAPSRARSHRGPECSHNLCFTRDLCRSELARDGCKDDALHQKARVIVNDHREQARSYSNCNPVYWISSGLTITQFLSAVTVKPSLVWAAAFLAIMPLIWVMYLSLRLT